MRIHYLFGNRYDLSDSKAVNDLRHRNAVYGVTDCMRDNGFNFEFHYCSDEGEQQFDIFANEIVINLHPQYTATQSHFIEAKMTGATCGVFLDSADTAEIFDESHSLNKSIRDADFVLVPTIHHANLVKGINSRVWVIPPIIETQSRLPSLDLDDVKKNNRPLRIACVLESENYESFIRILPDFIRFSNEILPVELKLISREPTGYNYPISSDTVVNTAQGLAQILTKNSQSISIFEQELTIDNLNKTLHETDCLFVVPSDDSIEGNIQIPLMGIHTGNFVFVPSKQKVFDLLTSYGVIPYSTDTLIETLKKTLTAPHEVLMGSMADGRKTIKTHHNPCHVASILTNALRTEYNRKKSPQRSAVKAPFDWNKITTKLSSKKEKQSETA